MGLRIKVVLWVLALYLLGGGASLWLLRAQVEHSYLELESKSALDDFSRVLRSLDDEFLLLDRVLLEWSLWEDLYQHQRVPDPAFAQRNLQPEAVTNSSLSWLAVYRMDGTLSANLASPADAALSLPQSLGPAVQQALSQGYLARKPAPRPCGIVRSGDQLLMLCQRALVGGEGRSNSAAAGFVTVTDRLGDRVVADVAERSGLLLSVRPIDATERLTGEAVAAELPSLTGPGPLRIETEKHRLYLRWPLRDINGVPVAVLEASWPRQIMERSQELLRRVSWLVLGLAAALALGIMLVIDRAVVVRLARLSRELDDIQLRRDWTRTVTVRGRDEITRMAAGANHFLGVIASQVQALEQLSQTDALTELANRRCFTERLDQALRSRQRTGEPLCLLLLDVDFFKAFNDRYGHQEGDFALKALSECLAQVARRPGDLAARLGGEEFALLLEQTDLEGARHCAAEVQAALRARGIPHEACSGGLLTVSMGLAMAQAGDTADSLYLRADTALYRAKASGRDRLSE